MKSIILIVICLLGETFCAPIFLTFEGVVSSSNSGGSFNTPDFGSMAKIVIQIDLEESAYMIDEYGHISGFGPGSVNEICFLAKWVESPRITGGAGNINPIRTYLADATAKILPDQGGHTIFRVSPENQEAFNVLEVSTFNFGIREVTVGTPFHAEAVAYDDVALVTWGADVVVTSISKTYPGSETVAIPEPDTFYLFATAGMLLIGVFLNRRRTNPGMPSEGFNRHPAAAIPPPSARPAGCRSRRRRETNYPALP